MPAPVLPGAEALSHAGGAGAVLLLHGFTGCPQSIRPVADALVASGFSVEMPLLPGHGTALEDLLDKRWSDWTAAAEDAYRELAGRAQAVCVAGLSMGGSLACWLCEKHPEIVGMAVVNPFVEPPAESFRDVLRGVLESGAPIAPGVGSDIALEGERELAYDGTPIEAALSLFEGLDEVAADLPHISCPVLLLSSRADHVVPSSSGDLLASSVSGPVERVWLERSYHVATLDFDRDEIAERVTNFAGKVLGERRR